MKAEQKSILLVSVNTFYGGGEVHVLNLARLLAGHCDVHALVFDPTLARQLREQGITVHQLSFFPRAARALQVLHAFFVLPSIIRRNRIRAVLITGTIETLLLPISRALGCPSISMRHVVPSLGHGNRPSQLRKLMIEMVYCFGVSFADTVICVSEAVAVGMRRITFRRRVLVIPNWVPSVPVKNVPRESRHPVRLLYVGRLEVMKGLHLLLQALRGMSGYELTVVGDGTQMAQLRSMATGMDVLFCGFQSDTTEYYGNTDVFVMPSIGPEGLPLVTIEAMSHALPCVLSDLPVHIEVSQDGGGAMLFKSGDAASLRAKLQLLMDSEEERKRLGDAAYQLVLQRHSPEVAMKAYLRALAISDSENQ